jgi:hypothetical protein
MPKSRIILVIGFLLALLPSLGFPPSWDEFFMVASGLLIVLLSVLISVDRRLTLKAKAEKRVARKRALVTNSITEEVSEPREVTSENTVMYGRRATDRRVPVRDAEVSMSEEVPNNNFE